jgi:hypothetical protein
VVRIGHGITTRESIRVERRVGRHRGRVSCARRCASSRLPRNWDSKRSEIKSYDTFVSFASRALLARLPDTPETYRVAPSSSSRDGGRTGNT